MLWALSVEVKVIFVETMSAETRFIFDSVIGSMIFLPCQWKYGHVLDYFNGSKLFLLKLCQPKQGLL
jgi:hypothetical protein